MISRKFTISGLSFLFLVGSLHLDLKSHAHIFSYVDDLSICKLNCDDENHHSLPHQCEKCLNNNYRSIGQQSSEFLYTNDYTISYISIDNTVISSYLSFDLYGRPPPQNLA